MEIDRIENCIKELEDDIMHNRRNIQRLKEQTKDKIVLLLKFKQMRNERNII